jgi:cbb3-type cytochrome oxidase subunit 1
LNGTHHYIFSVIPMSAQIGAITASTLLGVDVVIVVANLLFSLRGAGWFPRDVALRFVSTGTVFYLIVSIQGSVQAQMSVNQSIHFSDWVVGHSHLAMLGFASFAAAGGLIHAWQRIPWARYNLRMLEWSYWLLFAGVIIMVSDLTIAGLAEARIWQTSQPWIESVCAARPYWLIRTLSVVPIGAGFVTLLMGLTTGDRGTGLDTVKASIGLEPIQEIAPVFSESTASEPL